MFNERSGLQSVQMASTKWFRLGVFLVGLILLCACQEFTVNLEYPDQTAGAEGTSPGTPNLAGTDIPISGTIDPMLYFFPDEALPQGIAFSSEALKSYFISYLPGPNKMTGVAFVRHYSAYYQDFEIEQIIIQCPYSVPLDMFNAGHSGEVLNLPPEGYSLGQGTLVNSLQDGNQREVRYRFYRNNIMVILDLHGSNEFVSLDNAYQLAQIIAAQIARILSRGGNAHYIAA